jgi:hypothetical protein
LRDVSIIACDIRAAKFSDGKNMESVDLSGSVYNSRIHKPDERDFFDKKTLKILAQSRKRYTII